VYSKPCTLDLGGLFSKVRVCHLGLLSLAGRGDDLLKVIGVLGVLAEIGFDGLQDRGVRQRSDP
jgi:hypothetical protein